MPRPFRAKRSSICLACGGQIIKGVHMVMKRFSHDDWVHNRRTCLDSEVLLELPARKEVR